MAGYQDMINRAVMAAVNRARETGGPNSGGVPPSNVQPLPPIQFPTPGPQTPFPMPMPVPGNPQGQIGGYAHPQSPGIVAMRDAMRNGTPIPNMRLGAGAPRLPAGYPDTMPMPGSPQAQRQDPAVMALLAQLMKRRG